MHEHLSPPLAGTEIAGGFLSGTLVQPQSASTFSTPTIGTHLVLLAADGTQSPHGRPEAVVGELALVSPLLGSSQSLMNRDHHDVYYRVRRDSALSIELNKAFQGAL